MTITVNSTSHVVEEKITLIKLIDTLAIDVKGKAFAVNFKVITASAFHSYQLAEGDEVLIISATQGG